jgi:hypothetical protein
VNEESAMPVLWWSPTGGLIRGGTNGGYDDAVRLVPEGRELAARVQRVLTMTVSSWEEHAEEFDEDDPDGAQAWRSAAEELREVRDRLVPETKR